MTLFSWQLSTFTIISHYCNAKILFSLLKCHTFWHYWYCIGPKRMILSAVLNAKHNWNFIRLVFRECFVNITLIFFADLFWAKPFQMCDFTVFGSLWFVVRHTLVVSISCDRITQSWCALSWGVNFTSVRSDTFHRGLLQPVGCGGLNNIVCFDCG